MVVAFKYIIEVDGAPVVARNRKTDGISGFIVGRKPDTDAAGISELARTRANVIRMPRFLRSRPADADPAVSEG